MNDLLIPKTMCVNCKFHKHIVKNSQAPNVWYNHFCGASPLPETIDPVTGETGYAAVNSLGMSVIVDTPYHYCRDINTGYCPLFSEK